MFREQGLVSLWVGTAKDRDALEESLSFEYTEDGDATPNSFGAEFGIDWFDEDFREATVIHPPSNSVPEVLARFSYGDVIVPGFVGLIGETFDLMVDAVVLLYDFNYDGRVREITTDSIKLKFIGVVAYE